MYVTLAHWLQIDLLLHQGYMDYNKLGITKIIIIIIKKKKKKKKKEKQQFKILFHHHRLFDNLQEDVFMHSNFLQFSPRFSPS